MTEKEAVVIGGVDTHKETHCAAVVTPFGQRLGCKSFTADNRGYGELIGWMGSFGQIQMLGVECTGTYGAGLAAFAMKRGIEVHEVAKANKEERRRRGKDDVKDAYQAAYHTLSGEDRGIAKDHGGLAEALRFLKTTYDSAVKAHTATINALHAAIVTLDDGWRMEFKGKGAKQTVDICSAFRLSGGTGKVREDAIKQSLRSLAKRAQMLDGEAKGLKGRIEVLAEAIAPKTLSLPNVGPLCTADLILAIGENAGRLKSEAAFASLCGLCPVPASSGNTNHMRINRGGNRAANKAIRIIAVGRKSTCEKTKRYMDKKMKEGKTNKDATRCLKRYVGREVYAALKQDMLGDAASLQPCVHNHSAGSRRQYNTYNHSKGWA
jgi:transposase